MVARPSPEALYIYFRGMKIIQKALGNSVSHEVKKQKVDFALVLNTDQTAYSQKWINFSNS